jgi:hypothetical protein
MNRSERRKSERKYGQVFTMQKYREEAECEGRRQAIDIILTMMAWTINEHCGFGRKRLTRLIEQIMLNIDSFRTGQLTPEDYNAIKQELKEKGIII